MAEDDQKMSISVSQLQESRVQFPTENPMKVVSLPPLSPMTRSSTVESEAGAWRTFRNLVIKGGEKAVDANFQQIRSLGTPYATWIHHWGVTVGIVIMGEYEGWNIGLTYGWGSLLVATIIANYFYWSLILCLAEMTAALPFTGGPSLFATAAFGSLAGSIVGYSYVFEFLLYGASTLLATTQVLGEFFNADEKWQPLIGFFFLCIFTVTNFTKKLAFRVSVILTMIAFVLVFIYILAVLPGLYNARAMMFSFPTIASFTNISTDVFFPLGIPGILEALPYAIWFFIGTEIVPLCAEETVQPEKNSPKGLIYSLATLTLLAWVTLIIVPMTSPGSTVLALSAQPYVDSLLGTYNVTSISVIKTIQFFGLFGFLATLHASVFAYTRHLYALSRGGHLPVWISVTDPKTQGPVRAAIFGSVIVYILCCFSWFTTIEIIDLFLMNGAVMYALFSYCGEFSAFIVLNYKMPTLNRPFKNPMGVKGAIFGVILSLTMFILCMVYLKAFLLSGIVFICMVLVLIPYYLIFARRWLVLTPEKVFVQASMKNRRTQKFSTNTTFKSQA